MARPDKSPEALARARAAGRWPSVTTPVLLLAFATVCSPACSRMMTSGASQAVKDAELKAANGEYLDAIALYETALDDSARAAEVHYRMALLYDDKMNDPLHALHHFKRYLTLAPGGEHSDEVKRLMKRDELSLVTSLSGDSVVTRAEAARLRNDNLKLRRELEQPGAQARAAGSHADKGAGRSVRAKPGPPRSHVVQPGDTLFSLSRQFYHSPERWKDILDANSAAIEDPGKLKVGQTLTIP